MGSDKEDILRLERETFQAVEGAVLRPVNLRLARGYDALLGDVVGCLEGGAGEGVRGCLERAEKRHHNEYRRSGELLTGLEVG